MAKSEEAKKDLYQNLDLSVLDRLMVAELLPARQDITMLRLIRVFRESLSFSQEELAILDFQPGPENQGLQWKDEGAARVGIKRVSVPVAIYLDLQEKLKQLNADKQLTAGHMDLYERLVG
ncbi:hypothetical protein LCGC14_1679500 [marine sediment metagenome]|uniref:Uncharacterized protein n=1 Tax=marine sediment metagenome TaxID=412755 RepID=A0A0F9HP64_9ZZZZ